MSSSSPEAKFGANLSTLFMDIPDHIESYRQVLKRQDYKFGSVEAQDPYRNSLDDWKMVLESANESRPEFTLINGINMLMKYGRNPTVEEFESCLVTVGDYVKTLHVRKVHLVLGFVEKPEDFTLMKQLLKKGAQYLHQLGVMCVIEPLSGLPGYYLTSYDVALELILELKEPNLKIMFDTFHCQMLHGNLTHYIEHLKDHIGHVQVSQAPLRDAPMNAGETDHGYLLKKITAVYHDYIGLEYYNDSSDSFDWAKKYNQQQQQEQQQQQQQQ